MLLYLHSSSLASKCKLLDDLYRILFIYFCKLFHEFSSLALLLLKCQPKSFSFKDGLSQDNNSYRQRIILILRNE